MEYYAIETQISDALEFIQRVDGATIAEAARECDVPYWRLRARVASRPSRSTRPTNNLRLICDQEEALQIYMRRLDQIGLCACLPLVLNAVNSILARSHTDPTTPPPKIGQHWAQRWRICNPNWFKIEQKPLDLVPAAAQDITDIEEWFASFKATCDEEGILPCNIWSMDETGLRIGIAKHQFVLTEFPKRRITLPNAGNRESVTIVEAISAGGEFIPAMLILSGKTHNASWFKHLHDGTLVGVTEARHGCEDYNKLEFLADFDRFRRQALKRTTILSAFAKTGLVPFRPNVVVDPLRVTEEHQCGPRPQEDNRDPFATPSPNRNHRLSVRHR